MADTEKSSKKKRKTKRDILLAALIVIVAAVFIFCLLPIINGGILIRGYQEFKDRYNDSMLYMRSHSGAVVSDGAEEYMITPDSCSRIYNLILTIGMGKPQKEAPAGSPLIINFQDGSRICIWQCEITDKARVSDTGIFIRYEDTDGYVYQYDTDLLQLESITNALVRKPVKDVAP